MWLGVWRACGGHTLGCVFVGVARYCRCAARLYRAGWRSAFSEGAERRTELQSTLVWTVCLCFAGAGRLLVKALAARHAPAIPARPRDTASACVCFAAKPRRGCIELAYKCAFEPAGKPHGASGGAFEAPRGRRLTAGQRAGRGLVFEKKRERRAPGSSQTAPGPHPPPTAAAQAARLKRLGRVQAADRPCGSPQAVAGGAPTAKRQPLGSAEDNPAGRAGRVYTSLL